MLAAVASGLTNAPSGSARKTQLMVNHQSLLGKERRPMAAEKRKKKHNAFLIAGARAAPGQYVCYLLGRAARGTTVT